MFLIEQGRGSGLRVLTFRLKLAPNMPVTSLQQDLDEHRIEGAAGGGFGT